MRSALQPIRETVSASEAAEPKVNDQQTPGDKPAPAVGRTLRPSSTRAARSERGDDVPADLPDLDTITGVDSGRVGDHLGVFHLLQAAFRGPSRESFFASLEDPFYEPCNRFVIRRGTRVLSQVQRVDRVLRFGSVCCPVSYLWALATLPEFRDRGFGRRVLEAAEQSVSATGVPLAFLTTKIPGYFSRDGWVSCARQELPRANTRRLLAQLSAGGVAHGNVSQGGGDLQIRPWRQVELAGLMQIYVRHTAASDGALERSEGYWRWLIGRQGFDHLYIALESPRPVQESEATDPGNFFDSPETEPSEPSELPETLPIDTSAPIVGYVVTKDDRVLELVADPGRPDVARRLLARACQDAIERDFHGIQLHATTGGTLGALFEAVTSADAPTRRPTAPHAGQREPAPEAPRGEVQMAKITDLARLLTLLANSWHERALAQGLDLPCELGLWIDNEKHQLMFARRGVKVVHQKLGRSYLQLSRADFTRLVLGHLDLADSIARGTARVSTRLAADAARTIFPRVRLWRSIWDDLYL